MKKSFLSLLLFTFVSYLPLQVSSKYTKGIVVIYTKSTKSDLGQLIIITVNDSNYVQNATN